MPLPLSYQCPDCGATSDCTPDRCCDTCILKFYFENVNASNFGDWREPVAQPEPDDCAHEWLGACAVRHRR